MTTQSWWTAARDATLRQKWTLGLPTAEIAHDMQTTKNAVIGRARRLQLPPRASPIVRREETPEQAAARRKGVAERREAAAIRTRRLHMAVEVAGRPARGDAMRGDTLAILGVTPPAAPAPAIPVMTLNRPSGGCCWPMWGSERPTHRFCDAQSVPGRPYCPEHCGRAYAQPETPRQEAVA